MPRYAYPAPIAGSTYTWVWQVRDLTTDEDLDDHTGPMSGVSQHNRDNCGFRPRPHSLQNNQGAPFLIWNRALQLEADMFNLFASGIDPATINEGGHRWPNDPSYFDDFSSSESEDEDEAVKPKPKVKPKGKGCNEDKHGDRMDSDDEDDESDANSPTKGKNTPAARRGGRTARSATNTSSKQSTINKAADAQLTSLLTPTKRKVSAGLNESASPKKVRFASTLEDSDVGTQVTVGNKHAVSTPTKRPRKKPEMMVKRGSRTGIDAPAYNIKLPNVTITTIEMLTFLPELTRDANAMKRLASNSWAVHVITTILNEVRSWPETHKRMFTRSTVLGRFKKAFGSGWKESEYQSRVPRDARITDYTTAYFSIFRDSSLINDVSLTSLCRNVKAFPTGDEAGVLTAAVLLVQAQPQLDCKLSKLAEFARQHNLAAPSYTVRKDKDSFDKWVKVASTKHSKSFGDLPEEKEETEKEKTVVDVEEEEVGEAVVGEEDGRFFEFDDDFAEFDAATVNFGEESVEDGTGDAGSGEMTAFDEFDNFGMFGTSMFDGAY